jgi:hypothetical protein
LQAISKFCFSFRKTAGGQQPPVIVALAEIVIAVLEGAWLCEEKEIMQVDAAVARFFPKISGPKSPERFAPTAQNP